MVINFYEKSYIFVIYLMIFWLVGIILLFSPLASNIYFKLIAFGLIVGAFFLLKDQIFKRKWVISICQDNIKIKGFTPGFHLLSTREEIPLDRIIKIHIGIKRPVPLWEGSSAADKKYLWIWYKTNGEEKEIYYPHLPNISHYKRLIELLSKNEKLKVEISM